MKYLLVFLLLTQQAFGYEVKFLNQGEQAPFQGYLMEPALEKQFRLLDKELDYNKKLVVSLEQINKSYEEQVSIMQTRIDNQSKELKEYRNDNGFLTKYGMFLLGAATATIVAFAVKKASQ